MTPLEQLHSDLESARRRSEREGSDRHSNPGRAARDFRAQMDAKAEASQIERAIAIASDLDTQAVRWSVDSHRKLHLLLADGSKFPLADGEKRDEQIQIYLDGMARPAFETRNALTLHALNPTASRNLAWVRERMQGVSTPKLRAGFLHAAGILENGGLTALAREADLFTEHDGEFGTYQVATAAGAAWLYACYLAGNVPMSAAAKKMPPQRNLELDEILHVIGIADGLDASLAQLAGR